MSLPPDLSKGHPPHYNPNDGKVWGSGLLIAGLLLVGGYLLVTGLFF